MKKPSKIPFEEFKSIFSRVPRFCIEVIIQTDQGVLLTLREIEPYKGSWHLPGGGLLFGEKIKDAIQRIAKEEVGLKVKVVKQFNVIEYFLNQNSEISGYSHAISVPYLVVPISRKIRGSSQASQIKFFKKLPTKIIPHHRKFLLDNKLIT